MPAMQHPQTFDELSSLFRDSWLQQAGLGLVAGPLPEPALRCDGCQGRVYEGVTWGGVFLCLRCALTIAEIACLKQSGRGLWLVPARDPARPKRPNAKATQLAVYRRDGFRCRYCGKPHPDLTLDHVDPLGPEAMSNYATACAPCNARKGRRTPAEAGMELRDVR